MPLYAPTCLKMKSNSNKWTNAEAAELDTLEEGARWNTRTSTSLAAQLFDSAVGPLETVAWSTGSSSVG